MYVWDHLDHIKVLSVDALFDLRGIFTWSFDYVIVRHDPVGVALLAALGANDYDESPVIETDCVCAVERPQYRSDAAGGCEL